ncbi:MAG: ribose-5-phosphate isomerase RpiA [Aestuariivirgaceae bacterium]
MSSVLEKEAAARAALAEVKDGMRLGVGTGSTIAAFLPLLAERVRGGLEIQAVPTSNATQRLATSLGLRLTSLDEVGALDLAIDGADEIDPNLDLIKGGGGALVREKIVAASSRRLVIVADRSKQVATLGAFPLAVEIVPFGAGATLRKLAKLVSQMGRDGRVTLRRRDGEAVVSDNGNLLADCSFGTIRDPLAVARAMADLPGVIDHGLFLGMADCAYLGTPQGVVTLHR